MSDSDALAIVLAWQGAANAQDIERLIALSDANIEIVGPRGSGFGHQLLRDWMARAGLTLETLRAFVREDQVAPDTMLLQRDLVTGEVIGEKTLASAFQVHDGQVARFARYDSLAEALEAAGLDPSDERLTTL